MRIAIGSDHRGFKLKQRVAELLTDSGYDYKDFGCDSEVSVDYPDIAREVADAVAKGEFEKILPKNLAPLIVKIDTTQHLEKERDKIYNAMTEAFKAGESSYFEELITTAKKGGNAALGAVDVKSAASKNEVDILFLNENIKHVDDVWEHIVDKVEEKGGLVKFIKTKDILSEYGGIAAKLRFK